MTTNVIDFQIKTANHRVPEIADKPSHLEYIIELEHQILELQQQVCALHRDLERARRKALDREDAGE